MLTFTLIVLGVLLNAFAQLFLKKGMLLIGNVAVSLAAIMELIPKAALNIYIWGGMACYAISILVWLVVLSKVEVSYAYPFLSIGYIVTAFIGYFFLGESMGMSKIIGILTICVGIVIMFRGQ